MKVSATTFKAKCLRYLDEVNATGEPLEISKHGKVVAVLHPPGRKMPWKSLRGQGFLHGEPGETAVAEDEIEALK